MEARQPAVPKTIQAAHERPRSHPYVAPKLSVERWRPSPREAGAWLDALARALIAAHRRSSGPPGA
jgi:hypothetical protein